MTLAACQSETDRRVLVMLVDDSAIVCGFTRRWIEGEPSVELVNARSDGAQPGLSDAIKPLRDLGSAALRMMNGEAA